jgi:hypothetical protein
MVVLTYTHRSRLYLYYTAVHGSASFTVLHIVDGHQFTVYCVAPAVESLQLALYI